MRHTAHAQADDDEFVTFDDQFYPTPQSLGRRAFAKFKEKTIARLLEPQAGRGDLADVVKDVTHDRSPAIDCIEIDLANQAILRSKGYRVVGTDFLQFRGACIYSHILMNPPFRTGVSHVLLAWSLLVSGELVAILNAQDIRCPRSLEQQHLMAIISEYGSVEFIEQAFRTPDTKRRTSVEVALIHLQKVSKSYVDFIAKLRQDVEGRHEAPHFSPTEIAIPRDTLENLVISFECAVEAAKDACLAQSRASHYAGRLDRSIGRDDGACSPVFFAAPFNEAYDELKERAWSTVLRSTEVLGKLSSQAQKRVEAGFKDICALEFTYENIWGFLDGLIAQQTQIQEQMICDVFDTFTEYHSENRSYYQGWKSNDKHRLNAFRLKGTRLVIPANRRDWYDTFTRSLSWDDAQRFRDFDKVFAMLDSKQPGTAFGLDELFGSRWQELKEGSRLSSDYFDVRMYRKAGTFHLFPRRRDLIDRINRVVGRVRQWLPHEQAAAPDGFWQQFERADEIASKEPKIHEQAYRAQHSWNEREKEQAREMMTAAHQEALQRLGIKYDHSMLVEHARAERTEPAPMQLLLEGQGN